MISTPELKRYLGKEILLSLNGSRNIQGRLVGYDLFLNLNLADTVELVPLKGKRRQGKDEPSTEAIKIGQCVIRGNSILSIQPLDAA